MKKTFITLTALLLSAVAGAKVTLPKMFSDGMVMQQQTQANLWGTAKASSAVNITTSWNNKTITVRSGNDGKWHTAVQLRI